MKELYIEKNCIPQCSRREFRKRIVNSIFSIGWFFSKLVLNFLTIFKQLFILNILCIHVFGTANITNLPRISNISVKVFFD